MAQHALMIPISANVVPIQRQLAHHPLVTMFTSIGIYLEVKFWRSHMTIPSSTVKIRTTPISPTQLASLTHLVMIRPGSRWKPSILRPT